MLEHFKIAYKITTNSLRLFVTFLFLHILELSIAQSQRITPHYSTVTEIPLYRGNQSLIIGDFNGDGFQDIGSYGNGVIAVIYNLSDSAYAPPKYFETESRNFIAAVEDINSDGLDDIVYLDFDKKFLRAYIGLEKDTIISKWKFKLDDIYTKIKLEDINNDNKKDIILFGKKNLGLTILLGKGDGTFKYPQTILDEYFFSELQICNCSEDNIPDIFAVNWVENKILYFTSYAPLKYLSPAIYSFSSEPIAINTFHMNDDEILDLSVLLEDRSTILILLGDNLGNYLLHDKVNINYKIDKYLFTNHYINNKFVTLSKQNRIFSIISKDNSLRYREEVIYSTISEFSDLSIYNQINSNLYDLVGVSEKGKKVYIIQSESEPKIHYAELKYISMPKPSAIFAYDLNNDKYPDLILSSSDDYSTSIYINQGNRNFSGMLSIKSFPKNITNLLFIQNIENSLQFLTTHDQIPTINLVTFSILDFTSYYYSISGISQPNILTFSKHSQNTGIGLDFIVSSLPENFKGIDIYYYKQFNKYKFSETIINSIGKDLLGIGFRDINLENISEYIYLKRTPKMNVVLGSYFLDSSYNVIRNKKHLEFIDTSTIHFHLIIKDINNDNFSDLILYSPQRMELMISLYNKWDSTFNKPHQKIENVNLASLNNIQFCDLDNDGRIDLLIGNIYTQTLQVYFNKGDGIFSSPETIMGIYGISSFVVNDFDLDSYIDLALVYKDGYLKFVYGQK